MLHPELAVYPNVTLLLDAENAVQPDSILCTAPRAGSHVYLNAKGYLCGSPELVCEITASTASVDIHEKLRAYRRNGIQEYLVWLTEEKKVLWFQLVDQAYVPKMPKAGKLSSTIFPGLVLDVKALLKMDRAKLVQGLVG